MSYSTKSENRDAPNRLKSTMKSVRGSSIRNRKKRKVAHTLAKPEPSRIGPESHKWETVQEMFLASRSKFVATAYSILRNHEDAEDAVQDAMLLAYLRLQSFEGRSAFTTWFTRILLNAALMIRRKRKLGRVESFSDFGENGETSWIEKIPTSRPDPEMACAAAETFQRVDDLLRKTTPVVRQAFTMTYCDELSIEEASALAGIPTGTFKARIFRARQHLLRRARRSLIAPIRCVTQKLLPFRKSSFPLGNTGPLEIPLPDTAFR